MTRRNLGAILLWLVCGGMFIISVTAIALRVIDSTPEQEPVQEETFEYDEALRQWIDCEYSLQEYATYGSKLLEWDEVLRLEGELEDLEAKFEDLEAEFGEYALKNHDICKRCADNEAKNWKLVVKAARRKYTKSLLKLRERDNLACGPLECGNGRYR